MFLADKTKAKCKAKGQRAKVLVQLKVISGGKEYYETNQRDRKEPDHEAL